MFVVIRALTYSALFVGFVLVFLPIRILDISGVTIDSIQWGGFRIAGACVVGAGSALALSCIVAFARLGEGTSAPFDPPRRLVVRGPYRYVRNPMYVGAFIALAGASLAYQSLLLLGYSLAFLLVAHLFVLGYEEPTLQRTFGSEYRSYCAQVARWIPRVR